MQPIEVEDPAQAATAGEAATQVVIPPQPERPGLNAVVCPAPVKPGLDVQDPVDASGEVKGTVFIKNRINEIIQLPGGGTYQFKRTRETVTDPKLIKKLRQVSEKYQIIVES